jgi:hypothetical protein
LKGGIQHRYRGQGGGEWRRGLMTMVQANGPTSENVGLHAMGGFCLKLQWCGCAGV